MADDPTQPQEESREDEWNRFSAIESRLDALEHRPEVESSQPVTQPSDEYTHSGIELVGRHVPEEHEEVISAHERQKVMLPGMYEIGALIEGAFIPLVRLKAGEVLEAIDRAAKSAEKPDADTE